MSEDRRWNSITFTPPGPVAAGWIADDTTPLPFIRGPGGSGKTTAAVFKGPRFLARNMPVCSDGVIRGRLTVIRDNYRRLQKTALKSWKLVFREDFPFSDYSGGQDRPVSHKLEFEIIRGGYPHGVKPEGAELARRLGERFPKEKRRFELEVDFFAVGDHAIEEMLRGYETSCGWLNEADLLNDRVAPFLYSRTGRYPSKLLLPDEMVELVERDLYQLPRQVYGDLNPPDMAHWVEQWDKAKRGGYKLYKQPSGLSDKAENRKGKSQAEYEQDLVAFDDYDAKRFVYGEPGYARDGIPVYVKEFVLDRHVSTSPIKVVRELPINIGVDAGGCPAFCIAQKHPSGQVRLLRARGTDPGTGAARFAEILNSFLLGEFRGVPVGLCFGDPSSFYGADKIAGELAWIQTVALAIGHNILPAPSNEPGIRQDAVKILLQRRIDGQEALLIDPDNDELIAGFAAHYKLGKDHNGKVTNDARPIKNHPWSDIHDATQYVVLGVQGMTEVKREASRGGRAGNVLPINVGTTARADFNVWDV